MNLDLGKSTWKRVTFGDVVRNVNVSVKDPAAAGIERVIAMEHLDPGELKISRWGSLEDGTTFTRRVRPGQTLFGKRRAYQRKAAYAEFDAICSGDILVFEPDHEQLLAEFLPFLVQSNGFYDHALGTSAGSLSPRTNWRDLATFEFDLPPLDEQQRIADLLWSIERHRGTLLGLNRGSDASLHRMLAESFGGANGEDFVISDLCTDVVGGVWGAPEGENEVDVLALGPRVYSDDAVEIRVDGCPTRSITTHQAKSRIIQPGDIILERSGGSPTQLVGRVVFATSGLPPTIPTDFQRLLRPNPELVHPRYLFWRLRHDWFAGVPRDFSKRTTNISNLSVTPYISRRIQVPTRAQQEHLLSCIDKFVHARDLVASESGAVAAVRDEVSSIVFGSAV